MPQLFNVLAGSMSLVGPRPPVAKEVVQYEPWQRRRLSVQPGLTCLWQISGRSEIGFEQWVRMDLWYVQTPEPLDRSEAAGPHAGQRDQRPRSVLNSLFEHGFPASRRP